MPNKILLITPPFTQLNTPYPASPYLKGFLKMHGHDVFQADLGIELINTIFSKEGFQKLFASARDTNNKISRNSSRILKNEQSYLQTVGPVMDFLQYRDNTLAQLLCSDHFLPRASRFDQLPDLEWSFGNIGVNDKARFLATLYIEDIGDLIKGRRDPAISVSAAMLKSSGCPLILFLRLDTALHQPENIIETWLLSLLKKHIEQYRPDVVGITIPFPGNLYAGLKCGHYIKKTYPRH